MSEPTLFDKIVSGELPSYKVWEDERYLAFLTPFPNTPGATVVIPKVNPGDNVFHLDDEALAGLMIAAKKVARLLEKALDVERVALVFEGEAVPYVHAKLYPMHDLRADRSHIVKIPTFFEAYPGYISTIEGPKMPDNQLAEIQKKIVQAQGATT